MSAFDDVVKMIEVLKGRYTDWTMEDLERAKAKARADRAAGIHRKASDMLVGGAIMVPTSWPIRPPVTVDTSDTVCPRCNSSDLIKVNGCIQCQKCHYKQDCNGW